MARACLSIGSNLGDRLGNCRRAIEWLNQAENVENLLVSSAWETEPVGKQDQPRFINLAVVLETGLSPHRLLDLCQDIENRMGRVRNERWGPRLIDLDLLLVDETVVRDERLNLPHARMHERRFVLAPLAEVAPGMRHPERNMTVDEMLSALEPSGPRVKKLDTQIQAPNSIGRPTTS
jgi:2-amino-4-hydroxy-6-hydroxymethyldihydropteridine diphosphokinase